MRRCLYADAFRDEEGFTTVGMVLALLITLSLVFSSAQVYRLNAAASETQNVADAAALAAMNEVGEFMIVVRVCDAVVLSLTLTSLAATGLGIVALCTPATAVVSEPLLKAGKEVMQARNTFAEKTAWGLNKLQRLLPFFAASNAASVAAANNKGESNYLALALLVPLKGEEISVGEADSDKLDEAVDDEADDVRRDSEEAERMAEKANEAKRRGFEHDCGAHPSYCLYERASTLAGMSGTQNPLFSSVDTWSFSVALKRAQAYYPRRLAQEAPEGSSVEDRARSALRTRFYEFAAQEVARGYVHETEESFEALFPHLPENTSEMRQTRLYTEAVYPITSNEEGVRVMHAWAGCPNANGAAGQGSLAQLESEAFSTCPECKFVVSSMGKVATASSSIDNGFEYHYKAVADAASDYEKARKELDPLADKVKERTGGLLDKVKQALKQAAGKRIEAAPPGRFGAVALVVNTGSTAPSRGFESSFVKATGMLGARAAVSAATLVAEPAHEGSTIISSLLDGVADKGGAAVGAAGMVLDCWSGLLCAYAKGQEALDEVLASATDSLPVASESGLGLWAAGSLCEAAATVGLQPANLDALKPVLVNSAHVASAGDDAVSARLLSLKEQAIAHPLATNDLFSSIVGVVEQEAIEAIQSMDGKVEIARIELFGDDGPSVPIEITLPPSVRNAASDVVSRVADGVRSAYAAVTGVCVWQ